MRVVGGEQAGAAPELLERGPQLVALSEHQALATRGHGRVVLVAGEAGAGKTALVNRFAADVREVARMLVGFCDALATPRPLGPLLDFGPLLGTVVRQLLETGAPRHELFAGVLAELGTGARPDVVVIEDMHWADEATLDLLRYLARRIAARRALLIVTYRDDELVPMHPLRIALGDIATGAEVHRLEVPPLSASAVAALAAPLGVDAGNLYRQTGGNAFFVTEVLGSPVAGVPTSVRDAVLARAARLAPSARRVLEAAAVIGVRVDLDLLEAVAHPGPADLEECQAHGMLLAVDADLAFRHEIARSTILEALPADRRRALHRAVLAALIARGLVPDALARVAEHAEGATDAGAVLKYATAAAERAISFGSHREAASQLARVLRWSDSLQDRDRAALLERHSRECAVSDRVEDARRSAANALELWRALGDQRREGDALRWLSRLAWMSNDLDQAEHLALEAVELLKTREIGRELAMAYSNLTQVYALQSRPEEVARWGPAAIELASRLGDAQTEVHALSNVGLARFESGDEGGAAMAEDANRRATELHLYEDVGRGLFNLFRVAVFRRDYERADGYFERGAACCREHDLEFWRGYFEAVRAISFLDRGRWDEAHRLAVAVLSESGAVAIRRMMALYVVGRIAVRRGDPDGTERLAEAIEASRVLPDFAWLLPLRAARAEAAFLAGDLSLAAEEAARALALVRPGMSWQRGELAYWLWRAGGLEGLPGDIAGPYALEISGRPLEAAALWRAIGCPYEEALALADSADEAAMRRGLGQLDALGARPAASWTLRRLRERGVRDVRRGPHVATRANPWELSAREIEILQFVADGLRNAEIASRLFISARTVDHHVAAIFAKLSVRSRTQAARLAREHGLAGSR
jgi:DNA-binding CsgD family transcriptional regulator/tetratricopeptide (TPR) repeat protein